jgi:hypothetical protein
LACVGKEGPDRGGQRAEANVIEEQHLDSSSKGDADAQGPSASLRRSTRTVLARARETHVADATAGGNPADPAASGPAAARTSRQAPCSSKRKGGVR